MYSLLKTKKIWVQNQQQSPLLFCCFLNNTHALLLFENKSFTIVNLFAKNTEQVVYTATQLTKNTVIDCKRIYANTCAVITDKKNQVFFVRFNSEDSIEIEYMLIDQGEFFENQRTTAEIVSFSNSQFVIMHQLYESKMIHLFVLTQKKQRSFEYSTKIISLQVQWTSSSYDLIKPLQKSEQFVIYQQKQTLQQIDWRMKFASINQDYEQKQIDFKAFLTEDHSILDVIAKDTNEYYLFVRKETLQTKLAEIQVWRCRMHNTHGHFVQSCELIFQYQFKNLTFIEILTVNYEMNYFITKNYSHELIDGQIYDNTIQIVNLDTGIILEKLYCNLKSFDISLNQELILDYSQELNNLQRHAIHVRTLFNKKIIYHSFLQNSTVLRKEELSNSFLSLILQLL